MRPLLASLALLLLAGRADALELTAGVTSGTPSEIWKRGFTGNFASGFLKLASLEAEIARLPGEADETSLTTFTASALLAPPIGPFTPFGGVGVGGFRQNVLGQVDNGTLHAFILGGKVRFGALFVVRADFRKLTLSGPPRLAADERWTLAAGVNF